MIIPLILSAVGILAILAEFFIPAAGLIGFGGAGAIIVSIIMVFRTSGALYGSLFLFGNLVLVPAIIIAYWKHFPRSFMGRHLILSHKSGASENLAKQESIAPGSKGITVTALRPAGTAAFDDQWVSVLSDGEFLDKNTPIRVIRIEGNRVFVESADPAEMIHIQKEQ